MLSTLFDFVEMWHDRRPAVQAPTAQAPPWVAALHRSLDVAAPTAVDTALCPKQLHPYQREAVEFALARGGKVLLGHEMGLGKTPIALTICSHFLRTEGPVLVVAPPVLLEQWASEIVAWVPSIGRQEVQIIRKGSDTPSALAKFVLVSYSLLVGVRKNNQQSNGHLRRTSRGAAYQIVVADEAHALKSHESARTVVLLPMLQQARHAVLMTGTPMANACAADVLPLFTALAPGAPSHRQWCARYCEENRPIYTGFRYVDRWVGVSPEHGGELHALLQRVMVRKRKEEVLSQLPPKRRSKVGGARHGCHRPPRHSLAARRRSRRALPSP